MKISLLLTLLSLALISPALCQNPPAENGESAENRDSNTKESDGPRRFWQASLPGGHYMVALDRISSISLHDYLLDGNVIVTEVTIDTNGRALGRVYHIAPVTDSMDHGAASRVVDKGRELIERAGQRAGTDVHNMAQKNYPTTTHAGMVEYRVLDVRDLQELYKSVRKSWETGKGRKLTIQ